MRILTLTNLYPNPYQPERAPFNREQLRALGARQVVRVIAPIPWTEELAARWGGKAGLPPQRRVLSDGLLVEHPRYLYPPRLLRSWYGDFFRWSVRRAFERAVAEFRPDLVFAPWAYPDGWAAVRLGRRAGLPVVIKVHGSDVLLLRDYPGRQGPTVEALRQADGVVAVSRHLAERVSALGVSPERVKVVYEGVDGRLFHPGSRQEARARLGLEGEGPILLFVGNLVPVKGLETLLDACAQLARAGVRFTTYLIGRGRLRSRLQRQVVHAGLTGRVRLPGPLPHAQLPDWFRAAELVVLPSFSEGVSVVLLEAAACGTPFVASRVGGIPEIAHLGANRLVPAGDVAGLARAIADGLAGGFARHGPPAVLRGHEDAASELAAFFGQVLGRRSGAAAVPVP